MQTKDVSILIKFVEPQYVSSFMNGLVHFEPLQYFADKEVNDGDEVIGDQYEGQSVYKINKKDKIWFGIYNDQGKVDSVEKLPPTVGTFKFGLNNVDMKQIGIASYVQLSLDRDFEMFDLDEVAKTCKFKIKSDVIESLNKFNDDERVPIAILNTPDFKKKLRKRNLSYSPVEYYEETDIAHMPGKDVPLFHNAFVKRNRYKDQREFRIATRLKNINKSEEFNVGLIRDVGRKFESVDDLKKIVAFCGGLYHIEEDA